MFTYENNQNMLWNTEIPDSTLKKKSRAVAYHFVIEGVVRKEWITRYIKTSEKNSDLLTKTICSGQDRKRKIR